MNLERNVSVFGTNFAQPPVGARTCALTAVAPTTVILPLDEVPARVVSNREVVCDMGDFLLQLQQSVTLQLHVRRSAGSEDLGGEGFNFTAYEPRRPPYVDAVSPAFGNCGESTTVEVRGLSP